MATKPPTPHQRVIERFGGFAAMAAAVSDTAMRRLAPSTVQGWHRRGHISNNWQQAVLEAGRGLEPPLGPGDFFDAPAKGGLTQLGGAAAIAAGPEEAVLETVANPNPGETYVVRFAAPEFTSLCPVTGQPDFAHLVVDYVPRKRIVESKSLKLFLASFRNHGAFHEDCTVAIARRIVAAAKPRWLRIGGYWYPRGGIPIDVFYQTGNPPAGVWLSDPGVAPYRGRG